MSKRKESEKMNQMAAQANQHYQRTQIESASPEKLILMLYDGAIRKTNSAKICHMEGNFPDFQNHVVRVQKIITELLGSLDMEKGGEVAVNLSRLYDYILTQLGLALIRNETEQLDTVRLILEELRLGWQEAIEKVASEQAQTIEQPQKTASVQARMNSYISAATSLATPSLNLAG